MKKIIGAALSLLLAATTAFAGSSTVLYTSAGSSTYRVGTDGSGNFFGMSALCDGAACAQIASVTAAGTSGTNGLAVQGMTSGVPLPVSASALPLPTGAATQTTLASLLTALGTPMQASGGSVTANAGTNLNTSALATSANQTNASQKTQIVDGSGNVIASTSNNLDVQCANCSGSGVSTADEATMTPGTSLFAGSGGFFQTTPTNSPLTTGQQGMFQVTANRALFSNLRNASGTEIGTAATPVQVSLANTAANATAVTVGQGTAANLNATVVNAGTFAVQAAATLNAETTKVIGTVRNVGSVGGVFDAIIGGTTPANAVLGGVNNAGAIAALQGDATNGLWVNIKAGAGSGGTALGDNAAWTAGTTNMTPIGCEFTTGGATAITTAHAATVGCTSRREAFADIEAVGGTASFANYGTTPGTVPSIPVNAFVTNSLTALVNNADSIAPVTSVTATAGNSPVNASLYGFDGTNFDRIRVNTSGQTVVVGAGTAGTGSGGVLSIQGVASGVAVPVSLAANQSVNVAQFGGVSTSTGQVAVSTAPVTATNTALVVDLRPDSPGIVATGGATTANSVPMILNSQYPVNSVTTAPQPVTATATGTTAATVATIPAVASKTAYICGFTITADATAIAVGTAVVSGTISGSLSYLQGVSAVTSGAGNLTQSFNPCVPASAANTAIVVTSAAAGTGGNTIVNAQGYYL